MYDVESASPYGPRNGFGRLGMPVYSEPPEEEEDESRKSSGAFGSLIPKFGQIGAKAATGGGWGAVSSGGLGLTATFLASLLSKVLRGAKANRAPGAYGPDDPGNRDLGGPFSF